MSVTTDISDTIGVIKDKKNAKLTRGSPSPEIHMDRMHQFWFILIFLSALMVWKLWSPPGTESKMPDLDLRDFSASLLSGTWRKLLSMTWFLYPLVIGAALVCFCWAVIYVDSNVPGKDPALPFFNQETGFNMPVQYATTLSVGVFVCVKMMCMSYGDQPVME